ncbi:hypothetical protein C0991_006718 [Blastosporella zonata]|nr:hypothetical protein C0991_006718 [Blastosporella zonata]
MAQASCKRKVRTYVLAFLEDSLINSRHMTMEVGGITYTWVPFGSSIRLFATQPFTQVLLIVIDQAQGAVNLMITEEAVGANLLEASIVVAVLLFSGRDFA